MRWDKGSGLGLAIVRQNIVFALSVKGIFLVLGALGFAGMWAAVFADVGVAMGALGSDAAMEAADVVIMDDQLTRLPLAIRIARRTMAIARQNIVFSIAVKIAILLISLLTNMGLWLAVFADVGVCLLAVLNSLRILRTK